MCDFIKVLIKKQTLISAAFRGRIRGGVGFNKISNLLIEACKKLIAVFDNQENKKKSAYQP